MSNKHDLAVDHEAEDREDYQPERTGKKTDGRGVSPVKKKKRDMTKGTFWVEMFSVRFISADKDGLRVRQRLAPCSRHVESGVGG